MEKLLTVKDVAELLQVSESLVYDLAEKGNLASCRPGNGRGCLRFTPADVRAYLEGCRKEQQTQNRPRRAKLKHLRL